MSQDTPKPLVYDTVFISDLHFGTIFSRPKLVYDFLRHIQCNHLVLGGDIIEGWRQEKRWYPFREMERRVMDRINFMQAEEGTEIIQLPGNHDERLRWFWDLEQARAVKEEPKDTKLPKLANHTYTFNDAASGKHASAQIRKRYIYDAPDGKRYEMLHGDQFDLESAGTGGFYDFISKKSDYFYDGFKEIDYRTRALRHFIKRRTGWKPSISHPVKKAAKSGVGVTSSVSLAIEQRAMEMTQKGSVRHGAYDGVVMGHLHDPKIEPYGDYLYLNAGDWVESFTAAVFPLDDEPKILDWDDHRSENDLDPLHGKKDENPYADYRGVTNLQLKFAHAIWDGTVKRRYMNAPEFNAQGTILMDGTLLPLHENTPAPEAAA